MTMMLMLFTVRIMRIILIVILNMKTCPAVTLGSWE